MVGHNIAFDLGFLERQGLRLANARCDTWDMAFVLLPRLSSYSLEKLADTVGDGHPHPHRAVEDAEVTKDVFVSLLEKLSELDVNALAEMQRLATRSEWVLSDVLRRQQGRETALFGDVKTGGGVGITGLDKESLSKRLRRGKSVRPNERVQQLDPDFVASLLERSSPLADAVAGFEQRPQQVAMARSVAEAINQGQRLIVEAGTGVGKSLAYLLPAVLYALSNNKRVVVSTNTINLQEQLLRKDLPDLVRGLADVDGVTADDLRFTQLKGRANYMCLRRWNHLRSSDALSAAEARVLAKTLLWLDTTDTGDRSELNLGYRGSAAPWDRISAQGALECPYAGGPCFLRAARERAAASHLVVVNHALLLSDVAAEGSLIPDYDILIVDEAHHLEEEATRHLGFELGQTRFDDHIQSLTGDRGLFSEAITAFRGSSAALTRRNSAEEIATKSLPLLARARDRAAKAFATLAGVITASAENGDGSWQEFRVTRSTRIQPAWSELEVEWENVDLTLSELGAALNELHVALDGLDEAGLVNYDGLMMEIVNAQQVNAELRRMLAEFIPQPKSDGIYWVTRKGRGSDVTLHSAPLHVGEMLEELLFSQKECVVMTSATLSAGGTFDHVRERTGFSDTEELLLGSPFDYPRAAMLCVPEDMPEPNSWAYQSAVEEAVSGAVRSVGGRTMALFTSHASLQATASAVRGDMEARGIAVLAQGVDGTPAQLMRRFLDDPQSLLLGTASFWEGVDLPGESLQVLLVTRLPFSVPTEPVFSARSELYEDPFYEYAVPMAVLRLRQGFGRLIRTKTDRGVAVILDHRIVSRRYGKAFLDSLPDVTFKRFSLHRLSEEIRAWLGA